MKKLLLVFALFTLFSCGNDEEVTRMSNQATISVKHNGQYSLVVAYLTKDKWKAIEPYVFGEVVHGDTTITVPINQDQNFVYIIHRQGTTKANPVEATMSYRDKNNTKTLSTPDDQLWDIYEFYPQIY